MATRRCCSGCSGSNNCYGTLNCVPGPYNCNCRNYPYYTGPCAQASCTDNCGNSTGCNCNNNCNNSNCNCNNRPCRPPWWDWEEVYPPVLPDPNPPTPPLPPSPNPGVHPTQAYGFFNAVPPVTVAAGGVIPLQTNLANAQYFTNNNGSILIRRAGTYLVTYTVQTPVGEETSNQYYLTLNGTAVNESALNVVNTATDEESHSYTMQVIIQAPANSTLALNASSAVSLETTALNPYNLTIVRLA